MSGGPPGPKNNREQPNESMPWLELSRMSCLRPNDCIANLCISRQPTCHFGDVPACSALPGLNLVLCNTLFGFATGLGPQTYIAFVGCCDAICNLAQGKAKLDTYCGMHKEPCQGGGAQIRMEPAEDTSRWAREQCVGFLRTMDSNHVSQAGSCWQGCARSGIGISLKEKAEHALKCQQQQAYEARHRVRTAVQHSERPSPLLRRHATQDRETELYGGITHVETCS